MDRRNIVFFTGMQRLARSLRQRGYRAAILKAKGETISDPEAVDFIVEYEPDMLDRLERHLERWPHREQICAVINRRERRVREHAILNRVTGSCGLTMEQASWVTDKYLMRKKLSEYDRSLTPLFELVDPLAPRLPPLRYPVLLKPRNFFKSQLIRRCDRSSEFFGALSELAALMGPAAERHGVSLSPTILAEEYLTGWHCSIDAFVDGDGEIHASPVVDLVPAESLGIDDYHVFARILPSRLGTESTRLLEDAVRKAADALGLRNCPLHVDMILAPDGARVIEAGARIGGYRSEMTELAYGFSLDEANLELVLGRRPRLKQRFQKAAAVLEFFPPGRGRLFAIEGLDEAGSLPSFWRAKQRISEGEEVGLARDGFLCPLFIVLHHEDPSVLLNDIERLRKIIRIEIR